MFSLIRLPRYQTGLRYGECGGDPAVRQESDDPACCHRGKRDGRFLNPLCTCLIDKWLQIELESLPITVGDWHYP